MSETTGTNAGEAASFWSDLDRHMQNPEFRRGCEEQERRLTESSAGEQERLPSMFATAVEAATRVLPDGTPLALAEQVALAVLHVALPLHETQHAAAWKAAHERATHFELKAVKATERAEKAETEVRKLAGLNRDLANEAANVRTELAGLRKRIGEPETVWGHQVHSDDGHLGDEVSQASEQSARRAVRYLNAHVLPPASRAKLIKHEVYEYATPWQVVEEDGSDG